MDLRGRLATRSERSEASKIDKIDIMQAFHWSDSNPPASSSPGAPRRQPGSSRVAMERDAWSQGGGGGHLVPMGDSGGALLAGIGCVVERLGVGAAIPSGGTASSASVAAPGWHHAQPSGEYHALVCRRTQRRAMDRAVTGAIRAAASNDLHGAQRHRVYLVGQGAAHVSVGASRQVERTHGPDRTQERDRQGRDAHHRSIRAHRGHCARARSPSLHGLPPSLIPPALFPRATRRVRSGLAAFAALGYSSSRATAGGGVECRAFKLS